MKTKGLISIGLVIIVLAVVFLYAIFPGMAKLPADYEQEYLFEGSISQLNPATFQLDEAPTSITRLLTADRIEGDDVLILKQDITITHAQAGIVLSATSEEYGLDRTTRANVSGHGDINRSGQFTFPADVEQSSYSFWSSSAGKTLTASFVSEETFKGLTVYNFKIDTKDIPYGSHALLGPQTMDVLTLIKVEPVSGVPVDTTTTTTVKAANPFNPAEKMPIYINTMSFTSATVDEMVDLAESTSNLILWASVYGFWILIGIGGVLLLIGIVNTVRSR